MRPSNTLTDGPILKALITLSIPIIISNLLQTAYQITDTYWVGRLGADAVAAVSLTFPVNFLLIALGGGLPIAGTVLIAQYKGRGDAAAMNHVAGQTFLMTMIVSVVLSVLGFLLAEPIMRLMGAGPDILAESVRFLRYTFLGFLFVFAYFVFESLMRGLGTPRLPMFIVLTTVVVNFFLDPLFIFGWGPVPAMGVSGAALATLCTQAMATFIGYGVLLRGKHGLNLRWADFKPDPAFIRRAFALGLPSSIEQGTRALGMTVLTVLVAGFGTTAVAAYGIGIRLLSMVFIPGMGLSVATSALVGQNIGAGKIDRAEQANRLACQLGFVILTLMGVVLFFAARAMAVFFVPDGGEAIGQATGFVRIMALTFGFIGVQMVMAGTLRGAGDTRAAMLIAVLSQWLMQLPAAYALSEWTSLGADGIWWSFAVSNVLTAIVTWIWFQRGTWKTKRLLGEDKRLREEVREEALADEGAVA